MNASDKENLIKNIRQFGITVAAQMAGISRPEAKSVAETYAVMHINQTARGPEILEKSNFKIPENSEVIIDTFKLHTQASYDRIRALEAEAMFMAQEGKPTEWIEEKMKTETENYLRLTHATLKYKIN